MIKPIYYMGEIKGKKYKPDMLFSYIIAIPDVKVKEFALLVDHDGLHDALTDSMQRLAQEGKAPYCVCVGVYPGKLVFNDCTERGMRMNSYDLFDREYGDFLVYELIPYIIEKHGLKISSSPDMKMIAGGSSGGISAFTVAWFHPEYFHRVYMSSPSFLAMGRGNEMPYLIRKYETKPLRIYEELSENEPNDYFGSSYPVGLEAKNALTFAKYDFNFKYFQGEGHCSRYGDENEAYIRNEWLWKDYDKEPIIVKANSERVDKVIPFGSKWEKTNVFPKDKLEQTPFSEKYESVVSSSDCKMYYAANKNDDIVYSFVAENLSFDKSFIHATLHTIPRYNPKGALDLAVDTSDRLFVLTAIGVQCVRSFGLVDVILDLPDGKPLEIALKEKELYVKTDKGIFRREIICGDGTRKFVSYYD